MVVTKTPFRMSFFGGRTDFPAYFSSKPGAVISATFDKYCYVLAKHLPRLYSYKYELVYSRIERANSPDQLLHPSIRNAIEMLGIPSLRLLYDADLPARSGLGTSSSFAVGMLLAFHYLKNEVKDKETLAKEAIYLERVLCNETGGWQDQIAASYGGFNRINFSGSSFEVVPLSLKAERKRELNDRLFLYFTGTTRNSYKVFESSGQIDKSQVLDDMYSLVNEAQNILEDSSRNLDDWGDLLDNNWQLKKQTDSKVTSPKIDELYEHARHAGAMGGKVLGAGSGGFLLFYVNQKDRNHFLEVMGKTELTQVSFNFENKGTHLLSYQDSPL